MTVFQVKIWFDIRVVWKNIVSTQSLPDEDKDALQREIEHRFEYSEELNWLPQPVWSLSNTRLTAEIRFECPEEESARTYCDDVAFFLIDEFSNGFGKLGFRIRDCTIFVECPNEDNILFDSIA